LLLITLISLVYLDDYSVKCAGDRSDKQYLETQNLFTEEGSLEAAMEFNLWESVIPSAYASLPDGILVKKEMNHSEQFQNKLLSNIFLIDLPPPGFHI